MDRLLRFEFPGVLHHFFPLQNAKQNIFLIQDDFIIFIVSISIRNIKKQGILPR